MPIRQSRVPLLVLAHLGLLPFAACKPGETPLADPVASATATASASATPTTSATPTATGTTSATTTAIATTTASAASSAALKKGECRADNDCGAPYMDCKHAAGEKDGVGTCGYREHYNLGRPLVVEGVAHVAPYVGQITSEEGEALRRAAREEHASIAAFARTISELMALGAPTWLLFDTQAALADEIRHTELTLDAIERLTGERLVLGALEAAVALLRSGPDAAAALFRDVFRGGAVGETMAAAHAERQRDEASTDELRALYDAICVDEAKHAALAFKTLRWLLDGNAALAPVLDEERARLANDGSFEERTLVGPMLEYLA